MASCAGRDGWRNGRGRPGNLRSTIAFDSTPFRPCLSQPPPPEAVLFRRKCAGAFTSRGLIPFLSIYAVCHFLLRKWGYQKVATATKALAVCLWRRGAGAFDSLRSGRCPSPVGLPISASLRFRMFMRMQENFTGCRVLTYCVMSNCTRETPAEDWNHEPRISQIITDKMAWGCRSSIWRLEG